MFADLSDSPSVWIVMSSILRVMLGNGLVYPYSTQTHGRAIRNLKYSCRRNWRVIGLQWLCLDPMRSTE